MPTGAGASKPRALVVRRHHFLVRISHWLTIPPLLGLIVSGISIYWASPVYQHDPNRDLIMRHIRVLGSQQNDREYLHEALQIAASGKVKVMTETYSLDEISKAYERVADGKVRFRAVITTSN